MLKTIFDTFAKEMQVLFQRGHLSKNWPIDGRDNQQRWVHAMICGALAKSAPDDCIPMIEPTLSEGFRPDLVYLNHRQEKVAVIEYESGNSSDERLMAKDFTHYEAEIASYRDRKKHPGEASWVLPKLWLIISTLPSRPVQHWPWHGYNNLEKYPPIGKDRVLRDTNPFAYYDQALTEWSAATWHKVAHSIGQAATDIELVWANIDGYSITVESINGVRLKDGYSASIRTGVTNLSHPQDRRRLLAAPAPSPAA